MTITEYGNGIIRTSSGRLTYSPDGIVSQDVQSSLEPGMPMPRRPFESSDDTLSGRPAAPRRAQSLDGSTSDRSKPSSIDDKRQQSPRQPSEQLGNGSTTSHDPNDRAAAPVGITAGLAEEDFSREADVEKQRSRNMKDHADGEKKDPNLVEWDGPDDPVRYLPPLVYPPIHLGAHH